MNRRVAAALPLAGWIGIAFALGCVDPSDSRPGLRLSGEVQSELPADWAFADQYREIALEVHTPYLLPHSVTIWCAAAGGQLYLGARDPENKRWPGWVDSNPEVRLRIGEQIYEVALSPLTEGPELEQVQSAYAAKYELPVPPPADAPITRYWRVQARPS
jgi:hypothetical protein